MNNHFSNILEHFGNKVKNNKELVIKERISYKSMSIRWKKLRILLHSFES